MDRLFGGYLAELSYSYAANGDYYSGIYHRRFRRNKRAEEFLERFPRETIIPIHYSPAKPEISVVLTHDLSLRLVGF